MLVCKSVPKHQSVFHVSERWPMNNLEDLGKAWLCQSEGWNPLLLIVICILPFFYISAAEGGGDILDGNLFTPIYPCSTKSVVVLKGTEISDMDIPWRGSPEVMVIKIMIDYQFWKFLLTRLNTYQWLSSTHKVIFIIYVKKLFKII